MRIALSCTTLVFATSLLACGGPDVTQQDAANTPADSGMGHADAVQQDSEPIDLGAADAGETPDAGAFTVALSASATSVVDQTPVMLTAMPLGATSTVVHFYEADRRIASDTTPPFETTLTFTSADNGVHNYQAVAFSATGARAQSATVQIEVNFPRALYVDPLNGDDAHDGTIDAPLLTLHQAARLAQAGETIFLLDGKFFAPLDPFDATCLEIPPGVSVRAVNRGAASLQGPTDSTSCGLVFRGDGELDGVDFDNFDFAVQFRGGNMTVREVHVTNSVTAFETAETGHVIIEAPSTGSLVSFYRANAFGISVALVESGELTMRNGILEGDTNFAGAMVLARGDGRATFEGVTFRNNAKSAVLVYDNADVVLRDVTIDASPTAVVGLSGTSISLGGENTATPQTPTLSIERTHIVNSSGRAIYVVYYGGTNSQISVAVSDSELMNNGGSGILVDGPSFNVSPTLTLAITVATSSISGNGSDGINGSIADLQIMDSNIDDNGGAGVLLGNPAKGGSLLMRGTRVSGNSGDGVSYSMGMSNSCDFGTLADPGGNQFIGTLANRSGVNLAIPVACDASGNDWIPNVQGADNMGHYTSTGVRGPETGMNFTLVMDAAIIF